MLDLITPDCPPFVKQSVKEKKKSPLFFFFLSVQAYLVESLTTNYTLLEEAQKFFSPDLRLLGGGQRSLLIITDLASFHVQLLIFEKQNGYLQLMSQLTTKLK